MSKHKNKNDPTEVILDSITDGVFTVDNDWLITSFNRAAVEITGVLKEEAVGQHCSDVFHASICETNCAIKEMFESRQPVLNRAAYIINANGDRVPISVSAALLKDKAGNVIGGVETFRDLSAVEELRRELSKKYSFQDIISKNKVMLKIFDIFPGVAESDSTVLIEGESGTGKELVAHALHNLSYRKNGPIVTVNCGALPDTLLESELFGYKAGAFTDARKDKPGRFAMAEGGTIFLDEISDISRALQVRLLRVIQERTYEPLGATDSNRADVRIIAASNRNLEKLVKSGDFREDLYYRINVVSVKLPPLRERKEDIPLLINHFIRRFSNLKKKLISDISPDALALLMSHDYPGNIRELENIIEHAFVFCQGTVINIDSLPENIRPKEIKPLAGLKSMDDVEAIFITEVLKRNNFDRKKTAEELRMHKTTLWRKMKKLRITTPD
ncbi:MAG: sigma 54-interacting transcriptional regulator [candidate division Zixibacteria bacterium]|nr:sigma 54-interacting transcriptional regulator [candidate division Zixibacteria bacterium]